MKKHITILVLLLISLLYFTSCFSNKNSGKTKIKIVSSIFPYYDWVSQILGKDNLDFSSSLIIKNGTSFHNYTPTTTDFELIQNCDLLIYTGGKSEKWISDYISASSKPIRYINLQNCSEITKLYNSDDKTPDEHLWMSLKNAEAACKIISKELSALSPENSYSLEANLSDYIKKLDNLNEAYSDAVKNSQNKTLIICDVFSLRYLTSDYKINYFSAYPDCPLHNEEICDSTNLIAKNISELHVPAIIFTDSGNDKLARQILLKAESNKLCDILEIDTMHTTTLREAFNGKTYLDTMNSNLEILKKSIK